MCRPPIKLSSEDEESRPLSSFEDLFARSAPYLGMTCQWFRLSRSNVVHEMSGCEGTTTSHSKSSSYCTPTDIVTALRRVHRLIAPLRCVLQKSQDGKGVALVVKDDLEPDISLVQFDGSPMDAASLQLDAPQKEEDEQNTHTLLEKLAAREVTEGFGPTAECYHNRPLWRAKVLPSQGWVVVTFHHTICDGTSRKMFTAELMEALEKEGMATGGDSENFEKDHYGLHPGADDLLSRAVEKKNEANGDNIGADDDAGSASAAIADPLQRQPCWPKPDKVATLLERSIQAPSAAIPHAARLRDAARSHDVTVSAVILAALGMAVRNQLDEVDDSEAIAVTPMRIGVDVRRHLSDAMGDNGNKPPFGCYVIGSDIDSNLPIKANTGDDGISDMDTIWALARHISPSIPKATTLSTARSKCQELRSMLDVPLTPDVLAGLMEMINGPSQGRDCPANLSNIGVVRSESSGGSIRLERLFSITSQTTMGCYAFMNAATVNDCLCMTLGSVSPTVSKERAKDMLSDICSILKRVIGGVE